MIPADVDAALAWQAARTPEQVINEREHIMSTLEAVGRRMWQDGSCQRWMHGADETIACVAKSVNGPLLEDLCKAAAYEDAACLDFFKHGADLYWEMLVTSIGPPKEPKEREMKGSIADIWRQRAHSNAHLLSKLKEDIYHDELFKLTIEDAEHGRMSFPRQVVDQDLHLLRLCPRFGVEQGLREDGSVKVRAVDHMSWSVAPEGERAYYTRRQQKEHSVNGCTVVPVGIHHDHVDKLALVMRGFLRRLKVLPGLFKADVNAAFRRIPLRPSHRWAAAVVFRHQQQIMIASHMACPFGSTSAVYNWERVGSLLGALVRRVLHIAAVRYVDDFCAPERPETMEHAMGCLARLVRLLLGTSAIEDRKLAHGMSLIYLGVDIHISTAGFRLQPAQEKVEKCASMMKRALARNHLDAGCAEKLAGRLSWSSQLLFHRIGRAMLRPIFDQKFSKDGSITEALRAALLWWLFVLSLNLSEEHPWEVPRSSVARLFVDARGSPPRCAAVLIADGQCWYTDGKPSRVLLDRLSERSDNQIMALESLAIALGTSTFADEIRGKKVVVYNDNKAAEASKHKEMVCAQRYLCVCVFRPQQERAQPNAGTIAR